MAPCRAGPHWSARANLGRAFWLLVVTGHVTQGREGSLICSQLMVHLTASYGQLPSLALVFSLREGEGEYTLFLRPVEY